MRIRIITAVPAAEKKKRVCAYARVSTDSRRQEESGRIRNMRLLVSMQIRGSPDIVKTGRSSRRCWRKQEQVKSI